MLRINRITIVGAGAMGAAYASLFYEMDPGCVFLLAGGKRHERLKREGLVINGKKYFLSITNPEEGHPPSDLILVAVKNHHLDQAIRDMAHSVADHTVILSVMNGIDSEERIGAAYGMEKVLYAVVVGIDAVRNGNTVTFSKQGKLFFGEAVNHTLTERVKSLHSFFQKAGVVYETPEDMIRILWWKFMINVGMNQVSAVLRAPYRIFQQSYEASDLMEEAMREVIALAKAAQIHLEEKDIQSFYPFLLAMSPDGKTSMVQDVEAKRKTEVEMFAGKVTELGEKYGIATPINKVLYRLLKAMETYI